MVKNNYALWSYDIQKSFLKEFEVRLKKKWVNGIEMGFNANDQLILAGFFNETKNETVSGAFNLIISPQLSLLHTKQTHCKNVHCNSEHVLTVFSIAIAVCCFVPMVSTIKNQDSRAIQTQSNRHRCINYNHRGCCQPLWFCTCTWTYVHVAQAVKQ